MKLTHSMLFAALCFHAPSTGGEGGSNSPVSLEDRLAAARNELATATASLTSITTERDNLQSQNESLQSQFDALTTEATKLRSDLAAANTALTSAQSELKIEKATNLAHAANVARLESLCGIKGIDPKAAVPTSGADQGAGDKLTIASFEARIASENDPARRAAIVAEFEKAVSEGRVA